jgi:hypothetical protein
MEFDCSRCKALLAHYEHAVMAHVRSENQLGIVMLLYDSPARDKLAADTNILAGQRTTSRAELKLHEQEAHV